MTNPNSSINFTENFLILFCVTETQIKAFDQIFYQIFSWETQKILNLKFWHFDPRIVEINKFIAGHRKIFRKDRVTAQTDGRKKLLKNQKILLRFFQ